ncbi:calcium-binding protein [Planktothrix pseudagardhii]|uniref:Iron-regulated protein FrpA n=1 Tax=Planktothrix pseudagardhii TaxID=132604 RepID=A0A9W4G9J8_9CYAN|nr:hypothetical protein [Planktothrix pseudagardhii]CAD5981755.1 Iron-regulated protein FrpA [Planktothrix pseudagardhii]
MAVYYGNDSSNYLTGSSYDDQIYAYGGNDTVIGNGGNDYLEGGLGNDSVIGGSGNDTIDAFWATPYNGERDILNGGPGYDKFVIGDSYSGKGYLGNSWAVIQDFNWREDYIKVQGSLNQYSLLPGNVNGYGYSPSDMAIVSSSNSSEVYAIVINGNLNDPSNGNLKNLQLSTRDFISA